MELWRTWSARLPEEQEDSVRFRGVLPKDYIMKKIPQWVIDKQNISHDEEIIFIGKTGVDAVVDGKLPSGETYEWSKKNRRRLKKPKHRN